MKACRNCRFGDRIVPEDGPAFYMCRFLPPRPEVVTSAEGAPNIHWLQPAMLPAAWCGQFKLAFWKWLKNSVARAT